MDFCFSFAHGDQKAVGGAHPGVRLTQMLDRVSFPGISRKSKKGFSLGMIPAAWYQLQFPIHWMGTDLRVQMRICSPKPGFSQPDAGGHHGFWGQVCWSGLPNRLSLQSSIQVCVCAEVLTAAALHQAFIRVIYLENKPVLIIGNTKSHCSCDYNRVNGGEIESPE